MYNFLKKILIISALLMANPVLGLNSSSYLVANSAIKLFDFDKASVQFDKFSQNSNEVNLQNQLLTFINLHLISKANIIANEIISVNQFNEEAWIVYLANAKINDDLNIFKLYKKVQDKSEMDLLNYIFFSNTGDIKDNKLIARSILEVVQSSVSTNEDLIDYKFLLFYLSIASILDPNFNEVHFYIAQIYQLVKNYNKAEFFYNKVQQNHNLYIESQKNIAINNTKIGFDEKGVQILKNLIYDNNENVNLIIALADFYRTKKKYEEAIQYYTKIIDLKQNNFKEYWRVFYLRGICFERLKKWDFAEKDFLYSLKIESDSPQVLNYLAYGWLERNINLDKAMKMLRKAYQANPESFYIADSLAWAYYKKKELIKAAELMEKVIVMAPGEAISLDHLGDIYYSMNRKREAFFYWKQALDLAEDEDEIKDKLFEKLKIYNEG